MNGSCHCWTFTVLPDGRVYENPVPAEHKDWCPAGKPLPDPSRHQGEQKVPDENQ